MYLSAQNDLRSQPLPGTRHRHGPRGANDEATAPPITSGYGVVIEKEEKLRSANEGALGEIHGGQGSGTDRILHRHRDLLETTRALLRQRCGSLPHSERFAVLYQERFWTDNASGAAPREDLAALPDLMARHASLIGDLDALVAQADGRGRGEPLLAEIEHRHEDMAWMLIPLIKEAEMPPRLLLGAPSQAAEVSGSVQQERWENEGGAVRAEGTTSGG